MLTLDRWNAVKTGRARPANMTLLTLARWTAVKTGWDPQTWLCSHWKDGPLSRRAETRKHDLAYIGQIRQTLDGHLMFINFANKISTFIKQRLRKFVRRRNFIQNDEKSKDSIFCLTDSVLRRAGAVIPNRSTSDFRRCAIPVLRERRWFFDRFPTSLEKNASTNVLRTFIGVVFHQYFDSRNDSSWNHLLGTVLDDLGF